MDSKWENTGGDGQASVRDVGFGLEGLAIRLRVLRDALVWVVPLLMVSSVLLFVASLLQFLGMFTTLVDALLLLNERIVAMLPYGLTLAISMLLCLQKQLPRPASALLNLTYLAALLGMVDEERAFGKAVAYFLGITLPFVTLSLLARLMRVRWMRLATGHLAGPNVQDSLNLIVPGIFVGLGLFGVGAVMRELWLTLPTGWLLEIISVEEAWQGEVLYAGFNSLFWFVGIHGYYALLPLLQGINSVPSGGGLPSSAMGAFVFIGGCGSTFALALLLILRARTRMHRVLGLSSLPIACFNVNELLLFGLPIILNPRLFLPFFIAPMLNVALLHLAIHLGFVSIVSVEVPFNSPVFVNAWLATGGDLSGVLLQVACIVADMLLYLPFLFSLMRRAEGDDIHFRAFDAHFSERREAAVSLIDDPISVQQKAALERARLVKRLREISQHDFFLQFQPQVHPASGRVLGCEALIRARAPDGTVVMPNTFIPQFEAADLMLSVDQWVFESAVEHVREMRARGDAVPVTVNVGARSLGDKAFVDAAVATLACCHGLINFEITEQDIASDVDRILPALERLSGAGARIYVDDFGTGYSALGYLHLYPVDAIKIDRSFVLALEREKGRQVFEGLLAFARQLGLGIIVEGIETDEQLACLDKGDDICVQGWYYSKALDPDALASFVRARAHVACPV